MGTFKPKQITSGIENYILATTGGTTTWVPLSGISTSVSQLNDLTDVTTGLPLTPTVADDGRMLFYDFDAGQWVTDDTVTHGTVVINAKKSTAGTIAKGTPVYLVGFDSDLHTVEIANATSSATMPVIGLAGETIDDTNSKHIITFGKITGIDTTSASTIANGEVWLVNDDLYVDTSTGGLTKVRPVGASTQIQRVAKVLRVDASGGQLFVFNTARTAGLPNLTENYIWFGNASNQPIESTLSDALSTTANCISDLYVSRIHSCSPLLINPLDEGNVYMGSNSGFTYDSVNERVGVGNTTPTAKLHVTQTGSGNFFRCDDGGTNFFSVDDGIGFASNSFKTGLGGYTFNGDTNVKYLRNGSGNFGIFSSVATLGSTNLIQGTNNGRVGIGYNVSPSWDGNSSEMPATVTLKGEPSSTASTTDMIFMVTKNDEGETFKIKNDGSVGVGNITTLDARLHVQGAGSTNATNALLIENSSGTDILTVQDDGLVQINTTTTSTSYAGAIDGLNLLANIGDTNRAAAAFSTEYNPTTNNSNFIRSIATRTNKLGTFNTSHVIGVGAEARNSSTGSVGDLVGVDALTWVTGNATITRAFAVDANAQAQSGTITDFGSIRLTLGQSTAGATITNMYGIKIESPTNTGAAVTNTYGIRINSNTTGTNNWGIYQVGSTVNNYFDGNVGIGTDDPNDNLQVGTTGATATFRYVDGNQADGYVLTSDANGVATWMSGATGGGGTSKYAADVPMTGGTAVTVTHSLGSTDVTVQVKNPAGELITAGVVDNYLSNSVDIEVSITGTYRVIIIG